MVRKAIVSAVVVGATLLAATASYSAHPAGDATAGKDVFMKKCKTCHGEDGKGNQGMAKLLKTTIAALDSDDAQGKSDADIKKVVLEGTGKMKPVKEISDADIDNVIAYVRTFKKK
jgi:mono/diheme cytochrome c family protein